MQFFGLWLLCLVVFAEAARSTYARASGSSSSTTDIPVTTTTAVVQRHGRGRERAVPAITTTTTSTTPITSTADDDDEKKTLAQQVADGKYGLIQKELFSKPPKRPGILSYEANPEVPKDNVNNLGGLQPEEIWLAENHLLVLKGGSLRDTEPGHSTWPPIDDYVAPKRQVKIPANPRVPPPFPVQLSDGGPLEFLRGANGTGGQPPFPLTPPFPLPPPPPFNRSGSLPPLPPGLPPFFPFPLGGNFSSIDEDDPRLYYPPPYDFVYRKDNTSHVPPGPLVPGIVLPPPVDFFAPLEPKGRQRPGKQRPTKVNKPQPSGKRPAAKPVSRLRPYNNTISIFTTKSTPLFTSAIPLYSTTPAPYPPAYSTSSPPSYPPASTYTTSPTPLFTTTSAPFSTYPPVNEVSRQVPKIEIGEWIPIVGPSLCLLDGKNCIDIPYKNGEVDAYSLVYNKSSPDLYQIDINNITPVNKLPTYTPRTRQYYTTTPAPYTELKPVIVNPAVTTPQYDELSDSRYKQKETYYFYEEPVITEAKVIDTGHYSTITTPVPTVVYLDHGPKYETNIIPPAHSYRDDPVRKPKVNKVKPSRLHIYEQEINKLVGNDLDYLIGKGYLYGPPEGSPQAEYPSRQRTRGSRTRTKYEPRQRGHNAVFEYSFSAPGYGTRNAPKISAGIPTTERPWEDWQTSGREEAMNQEWRNPTQQEWQHPTRQEWQQPTRVEWQEPVQQEWRDPAHQEWQEPVREAWPVAGHSLTGDIAVNWRRPNPPVEPLAEILPGLVSYRLPGDGGHFFFLTPRAVRAESFHPASAGVRRPRRQRQSTSRRSR